MTTMTSPLVTPSPAASLLQRVLLLAPSLRYWRGQYRIRDAEVSVHGTKIDKKKTTQPRTKLLESSGDYVLSWYNRFREFENAKGKLVERFSQAFPINGVRIIPRDQAEPFFDAMVGPTDRGGRPVFAPGRECQSLAYRISVAADDFVEDYPNVMRHIREALEPSVWAYISKVIPAREKMRDKFGLDIAPVELAGGGSVEKTTREDLMRYDELIRASTLRLVDEAVSDMIAVPRQALGKALGELHELISRDGRVTTASFNGVREAINKIKMFSFVATDDLLHQINGLETRINGIEIPANLDSTTATSNGLLTALDSVRAEVEDEIKQADDVDRFGRTLRGFDFGN